jgi:hypothetical protein
LLLLSLVLLVLLLLGPLPAAAKPAPRVPLLSSASSVWQALPAV